MNIRLKIFIFLTVFAIICFGFTILFINLNLPTNNSINMPIKNEPIEDNFGIKNLTNKYNTNDLKIIKKTYEEGTKVYESDYYSYYPITIEYIQIDGLKNKDIQNKINQEIKNTVLNLTSLKELDEPNIKNIFIYSDCTANFSNTLSISITKSTILYDYTNYTYTPDFIGLNYDLTTGNKINFTDLFTTSASIKNILTQSMYTNLIIENFDYSLGFEAENVNYSNIAEIITNSIDFYTSGNKFEFAYTPQQIQVYLNNHYFTITMCNYYKSIAIYNRYITNDSLFTDNFNDSKNIYVFSLPKNEYTYYLKKDSILDNLFTYIEVFKDTSDNTNIITKHIDKEITNLKNIINKKMNYYTNNPNEAMLLKCNIYSYLQADGNLNIDIFLITTTSSSSYYKSTLFPSILKSIQDPNISEFYITDEMSNNTTSIEIRTNKIYNISTGELINEFTETHTY